MRNFGLEYVKFFCRLSRIQFSCWRSTKCLEIRLSVLSRISFGAFQNLFYTRLVYCLYKTSANMSISFWLLFSLMNALKQYSKISCNHLKHNTCFLTNAFYYFLLFFCVVLFIVEIFLRLREWFTCRGLLRQQRWCDERYRFQYFRLHGTFYRMWFDFSMFIYVCHFLFCIRNGRDFF